MLSERKVMHERVINFRGKRDTFQEQIFVRGWQFMYDPVVPINMSLVREFYANRDQKNQREVYIRGRKIPCYLGDIEEVLHIPRLKGVSEHNAVGVKYDSNELDLDEVVRVIGRDGATWPEGMTVSLPGVMVAAMNEDPTKSKRQLLPFPMFITKWAAKAGVSTYPGDEIFNVPKAQQFFPYGLWKEERGAAEDPIPPPMPSPVRPLVTHSSTPAPSSRSSQQPSRNELMRALRRNERVMRRHEQLLLMFHPGTDSSQFEQISSPEVSEHQQQATGDPEEEDGSDEDDSDDDSSEE
ncbi:hypothetical protein PIB30_076076 [Stylosanthes scabra]|uniref:Uncharacterized protein n=1 Tax=Stylosanthes scabra TaxID=79078 RepID=A0ABU6YQQ1_9FABA|nr:hypothetical protein [Stylosanthes scabra]